MVSTHPGDHNNEKKIDQTSQFSAIMILIFKLLLFLHHLMESAL